MRRYSHIVSRATIRHRQDPRQSLLYNARKAAKALDLPIDLRLDDIVIPGRCPALGIPLAVNSTGNARSSSNSPTLVRIRPESGYTGRNIAVISLRAAKMKSSQTLTELVERLENGRLRDTKKDLISLISWLRYRV